jgi:hypothetical protein
MSKNAKVSGFYQSIKSNAKLTLVGLGVTSALLAGWVGYVNAVQEPEPLSITQISENSNKVLGVTTAQTMVALLDKLLNQPLGYVSNDVAPPFVFLDDRPNWEAGVIRQLKLITMAMMNEFSRPNASSVPDNDLTAVMDALQAPSNKWIWVDYQQRLQEAMNSLNNYTDRLKTPDARNGNFVTKSTALIYYLDLVNKELGGLSQRLSASRKEVQINTDTVGEKSSEIAWQDTYYAVKSTPWLEIDDVFYQARGETYALKAILQALRVDCYSTIEDKNAIQIIDQAVHELTYALQPVDSFMILNGSRKSYGYLPNHSIRLSADITRAANGIRDLITLLSKG